MERSNKIKLIKVCFKLLIARRQDEVSLCDDVEFDTGEANEEQDNEGYGESAEVRNGVHMKAGLGNLTTKKQAQRQFFWLKI